MVVGAQPGLGDDARIGFSFEPPERPALLPIDRAVPTALIVNELLTNALKYAFPAPRAGRVRLVLAEDAAGALAITIADASDGIGMRIVSALARQLGAVLDIADAKPGTRFTLALPAA